MINLLSAAPHQQNDFVKKILEYTLSNPDRDILVNNWEDEYKPFKGHINKVANDFKKYGVITIGTPYTSLVAPELNEGNFYSDLGFAVTVKGQLVNNKGRSVSGQTLAEFICRLLETDLDDPVKALEFIIQQADMSRSENNAVLLLREENSSDVYVTSIYTQNGNIGGKVPLYVAYPDCHSMLLSTQYKVMEMAKSDNISQVSPCEVFRLFIKDNTIDIEDYG